MSFVVLGRASPIGPATAGTVELGRPAELGAGNVVLVNGGNTGEGIGSALLAGAATAADAAGAGGGRMVTSVEVLTGPELAR
jgi:hypothetical protein